MVARKGECGGTPRVGKKGDLKPNRRKNKRIGKRKKRSMY